jgi:hypothetical protein
MDVSEAKRLKTLEDENTRLKRLLADAMLDNAAAYARTIAKRDAPPGKVHARSGATRPPRCISAHRSAHQSIMRTRSSQKSARA